MGNKPRPTWREREMTLKTTKLRDAISFALVVGTCRYLGRCARPGTAAKRGSHHPRSHRGDWFAHQAHRHRNLTAGLLARPRRNQRTGPDLGRRHHAEHHANGSTLNSTFNNGGNGETRVSLRNLGSKRTLVLVNGRRWSAAPPRWRSRPEHHPGRGDRAHRSPEGRRLVDLRLRRHRRRGQRHPARTSTAPKPMPTSAQYDEGDGTRQSYDFTIGSSGDRGARC